MPFIVSQVNAGPQSSDTFLSLLSVTKQVILVQGGKMILWKNTRNIAQSIFRHNLYVTLFFEKRSSIISVIKKNWPK
jgi:hypothetical protein